MIARFYKIKSFVQYIVIFIVVAALWTPLFQNLPSTTPYFQNPLFQILFGWLQTMPTLSLIFSFVVILLSAVIFRFALNCERFRISSMQFPLLLFLIITHVPHMAMFSPIVGALLLLSIAMFIIFKIPESIDNDKLVFFSAFIIGLATLFYSTILFVVLIVIFPLLNFEKNVFRKIAITILGFLLPIIWYVSIFFFCGKIDAVLNKEMLLSFHIPFNFNDINPLIFSILALLFYIIFYVNLMTRRYSEMVVIIRRRLMISAVLFLILLLSAGFSYDLYEHLSLLALPMTAMMAYYYNEKTKSSWIDYALLFILATFIAYPYLNIWR